MNGCRKFILKKSSEKELFFDKDALEWLVNLFDSIAYMSGVIKTIALAADKGKKISKNAITKMVKDY